MAKTVISAFEEFMKDFVNLDPDIVSEARKSRDNLLDNISEFEGKEDFFSLYSGFNFHFGSFARKTKCRELNDIDLMIGISADGATYNSHDYWDDVRIYANPNIDIQKECMNDDGTLNSTKVTNKFKKQLENVREYSRSEIKKNGQAVVLNLISKEWSFDIVPCFHTVPEQDGRSYWLIPNGEGNWTKTDPQKDKDCITNANQNKDGRLLELIRLFKKWNKVKNAKTIPSYLLETLIVNYANSKSQLDEYIDWRFKDALKYISDNIMNEVQDMKEIQGNINNLSLENRSDIREKAMNDYNKACEAIEVESEGNQEKAIKIWGEIFGKDFPIYG